MVNNEAVRNYNRKYGMAAGDTEKQIDGKTKKQTVASIKTLKGMGFGTPRHPKKK